MGTYSIIELRLYKEEEMKFGERIFYAILFIGSIFLFGFLYVRYGPGFLDSLVQAPPRTTCQSDIYLEVMLLDNDIQKLYDQALQASRGSTIASLSMDLQKMREESNRSFDLSEEIQRLTEKKIRLLKMLPGISQEQLASPEGGIEF
ncbi:MAG: hypothetical protein UZ21_OP11001000580 [Microgenomates bacterium OLB22]|nr:MAG: hypothetical protein UZ21_OP11001000580 [Microgenomates bacterium OLB22]